MAATWPGAVSTAANLYTTVNLLQTTLSSTINNVVTTITLTSTTGFPTAGAVTIDNEVIFYTGISGGNLTGCVRASDGTTAATHNSGVPVGATVVAYHVNALNAEVIAIETFLSSLVGKNSAQIQAPLGLVGSPGYSFVGDLTTGWYGDGSGSIRGSISGVQQFKFAAGVMQTIVSGFQFQGDNGTVGAPSYSFGSDPDTGIIDFAANDLGFVTGGALRAHFTTTEFRSVVDVVAASHNSLGSATDWWARAYVGDGTLANPSLTFGNDTATGIRRRTSNTLTQTVGGVDQIELTLGGFESFNNGLFDKKLGIGGFSAKNFTLKDASSANTTPGTGIIGWIAGGNSANSTLAELGFSYGGSTADTNCPATFGYQLTSGTGFTKGDLVFCTRNVTTDTAPTEAFRIKADGTSVFTGGSAANQVTVNTASTNATMALNATGTRGASLRFQNAGTDEGFVGCEGTLLGTTSMNMTLYGSSGNGVNFYTNGSSTVALGIDTSNNVNVPTSGKLQVAGNKALVPIQVVSATTSTHTSTAATTGFPVTNLSVTFVPKSTSNLFTIEAYGCVSSTAGCKAMIRLQDSASFASNVLARVLGAVTNIPVALKTMYTIGSTASRTIAVRIQCDSSSSTVTWGSTNDDVEMTIVVTEYAQ